MGSSLSKSHLPRIYWSEETEQVIRTKGEVFAFIEANRNAFPVQMMCALLGVTRGGYYAWQRRQPSARAKADEELIEQVRQVHDNSRGYYSSPRVTGQLRPMKRLFN